MTDDLRPVPRRFRRVLRGYDPTEVDAYVESLQRRILDWEMRFRDLEANVVDRTQEADRYLEAATELLLSVSEVVADELPMYAPPPPPPTLDEATEAPEKVELDDQTSLEEPRAGLEPAASEPSATEPPPPEPPTPRTRVDVVRPITGDEPLPFALADDDTFDPEPVPERPSAEPAPDFDILDILDDPVHLPGSPSRSAADSADTTEMGKVPPGPEPDPKSGPESDDPDDLRPWAPPAG